MTSLSSKLRQKGNMQQLNPSVMIKLLSGDERDSWLNPVLIDSVFEAAGHAQEQKRELSLGLVAMRPVELARNYNVENFLKSKCQWLVQIDNDQVPLFPILDLIQAAEDDCKFIIGAPTPTLKPGGAVWNANQLGPDGKWSPYKTLPDGWFQPDVIGAGLLAVRRSVFLSMQFPWFEFNGTISEDYAFCQRAKAAGFGVWANSKFICNHIHSCGLLDLMNQNSQSAA